MSAKRLREESGYSLVEVMASLMILTIAILPMFAMFDTGLNSATRGSNYDKARALANLKLEQAKNLPFDSVRNNFPEPSGTTTTYDGAGRYQSAWKTESGAASADFTNLEYRVVKQYMAQPSAAPASAAEPFATSSTATDLIRVTVTVRWPNGGQYTTYGLVTR
jgi:prepilin-type N-terminal cleavage/methylation domain-containing protein